MDDCIDKFRQHEVEKKRLRLLNGQRGSTETAPVEFFMGAEGDPLSAVLNESGEDVKSPGAEDLLSGGGGWNNNTSIYTMVCYWYYIITVVCVSLKVKVCPAAPARAAFVGLSRSASWRTRASRSLRSSARAAAAWRGACRGSLGRESSWAPHGADTPAHPTTFSRLTLTRTAPCSSRCGGTENMLDLSFYLSIYKVNG